MPGRSDAMTALAALSASGAGVWEWNPRSERLSVSLFAATEDFADNSRSARVVPEDEARFATYLRSRATSGSPSVRVKLRIAVGDAARWYLASGGPRPDSPRVYTGLLTEIEDGHVAEPSSIETLYRTVFDSLSEEIAIVNRFGEIIDSNRAWRTTATGYSVLGRRIVTGSNYLDALRRAVEKHPNAAAVLDGIERVLKGHASHFQYEYSCTRDGRERWFAIRVTALQWPDGGLVVIHYDITERRLAERERDLHRAELGRTGRAAVLGQLSGAIAHELNQPLTAILANAQVGVDAAQKAGMNGELHAILVDIEHDTRRAGEVIKRVRDLLKHREAEFEPVDLNRIVADVLSLSRSDVLMRGVAVSTSLDHALPLMHGDAIELQQVLLNLIVNACEAMASTERGKRELHIATVASAEGRVVLTVSDSGIGFDTVERDRVLQPFYTTKDKGLGLGLSICASIVQAHGGAMKLGNSKRGGAEVTVEFPPLTVKEWHDLQSEHRTSPER